MDLFQTIKQIGVFMICAQVILHFRPSAKYEKYLKLLISVMVLVQIIVPMINLFTDNEDSDFYVRIEEIQSEIDKSMEQLEIENAINEENILNQTLEEIKSRINKIIKDEDYQVINVEYTEDRQGDALILYVDEKQKMQNIDIRINRINVGEQPVMGSAIAASDGDDNSDYKEKLHVLYNAVTTEIGLSENQIQVVWSGDA